MISINAQIIENIIRVTLKDDISKKVEASYDKVLVLKRFIKRKKVTKNYLKETKEKQLEYLKLLEEELESIVLADNQGILKYQKAFSAIIGEKAMTSAPYRQFRDKLLAALGYESLRNNFYSTYFELVGIKSCVYCNSQLALTVTNVDGKRSAKFQVDHVLPKAEYPCFSISFYNLYPVCASCNNSKKKKHLNWTLYSTDYRDFKASKFTFALEQKSLLKFRINGEKEKLKVKFTGSFSKEFNEMFAIEGIYETQKDIAEELVIKSMIYNKSYSKSLRDGLDKLYRLKSPMFERLLIGNYTRDMEIHKRPMSKFTMDIAKQLGLIK